MIHLALSSWGPAQLQLQLSSTQPLTPPYSYHFFGLADSRVYAEASTTAVVSPNHHVASPIPTRPPGHANASNNPLLFGPMADMPVPIPQPVMLNRPVFHQGHPSNGSLVFGGFQDSNASSPVPHSAGGFIPPVALPYPPVSMPVTAVDGFGRPLMVSPTLDTYGPAILNQHGPSTPHSFHGSQASMQADESGFASFPVMNGHNGHPREHMAQASIPPPGISAHMNGSLHGTVGSMQGWHRDQQDALNFLRHGVNDADWCDCVLEVRFPEPAVFQGHPHLQRLRRVVENRGHRFIFSRSPALAMIMQQQRTPPGGVLSLNVYDDYMRSDVFCYVLQTLYGWSLENSVLPTDLPPRDVRDDFKLMLSYLATGHYLQLASVERIAAQRAATLLYWETIDLAADFVLPRIALAPQSLQESADSGLRVLRDGLLDFVRRNLPKDFVLDVSAPDGEISRLPAVRHSTSNLSVPRRPSINPKLSQIKFGDISPTDSGVSGVGNSTEGAPLRRAPTDHETILSRILLNLPFELLKEVLEHPNLAKFSGGELAPSTRLAITTEIIAEREARRLRSLDKAHAELHPLQETLDRAPSPLHVQEFHHLLVNNMGFKEEVFMGDAPYLVHKWIHGGSDSAGP